MPSPSFADLPAMSLQGRELPSPHQQLGSARRPGRRAGLRQPPDPHKEGTKDERLSTRSQLGHPGRKPHRRPRPQAADDDRKVCNLRVAVNDQKNQPPMFIDVATFGAQADACAKYLSKGRAVAVTGRLVYREWDDNGTRRSRHHIVGRVQFGGRPDNGDQPTDTTENSEETADF